MRAMVGALLVLAGAACGVGGSPTGAVVTFQTVDGETFRVLVEDRAMLERIETALEGDGRAGIPNGRLVAGDGGVNVGHGWHLEDVELADMAMEICDGTVSYLDGLGVEAFIAEHGDRFCPWDARVVEIVPQGS